MTTVIGATGAGQTQVGYVSDEGGQIGTLTTPSLDAGQVVNVANPAFGATGNTVQAAQGGSIAASSPTFTQTAFTFTAADIGKVITVQGACGSGAVLSTTIAAVVSSTTVTLAASAQTTVTNAAFTYGTDDTQAIIRAIGAANGIAAVLVPAGTYTIRGASNNGDTNGGFQIHLETKGGFVGQGGKPGPSGSPANTVFLCADSTAGLVAVNPALYQGFMCDGNNIATNPLQNGIMTGTGVTDVRTSSGFGVSYATFVDVWACRSAGDGIAIFGSQNNAYYDCGTFDNARDGLYLDGGAGGLDFFHFYERGSRRYGIRGDGLVPAAGGFMIGASDNSFFGGVVEADPARPRTSAVYIRMANDWRFFDAKIDGTNASGPAIDLDQTYPTGYGLYFDGCAIAGAAGQSGIQVSGTPTINNRVIFLSCDRCSFMSGDYSVYFGARTPITSTSVSISRLMPRSTGRDRRPVSPTATSF